ncbi:MAG: aldehyde dehydrogenase family protein [Ornithinimicrobium sp.]|uniref:aldehyde dehydrogenase family protein n=1 Tax=Ornithinimicrobium sp. TaxID=1977084 RepID=UPI0026DFED12|nr:aldehyde dehydrogenase family protein [Ornithinimicrobium sp.]MDO5739788.1 aldehyde dehydrogenase family protein [Ornithinimicrobium sp.]
MSQRGSEFVQQVLQDQLSAYINNKPQAGQAESIDLINPSTGAPIGSLATASAAQVDEAVAAARAAFAAPGWADDDGGRAETLRRLATLVHEHGDVIAYLDAIEAGKVHRLSIDEDVADVVANLRYFADLADHHDGRQVQTAGGWGWVRGVPIGVVGVVLPWNFPIAMLGWKVAPALAAGNALVLKPSEDSVLSALFFAELAREAGVPDGILNVLVGDGEHTGAALGRHDDIDMVTFTGSGQVGREFLRYAADSNLKRISLELGGRAAYIVDAEHTRNPGGIAEDIVGAAFGNAGQNCTATSRVVFVGEPEAYEKFAGALAEQALRFRVADPMSGEAAMGPVINGAARDRILAWVDEAIAAGASVLARQVDVPEGDGFWVAPTLLQNVPNSATLGTGEVFGPVAQVLRVDTREEAVELVNGEPYGLASTVWCEDLAMAKWWSDQVRVGTLALNGYSEGTVATPFGGLRQSGFWGRDNGPEALDGYRELMTVWVTTP